jgi:hypothetical protein
MTKKIDVTMRVKGLLPIIKDSRLMSLLPEDIYYPLKLIT